MENKIKQNNNNKKGMLRKAKGCLAQPTQVGHLGPCDSEKDVPETEGSGCLEQCSFPSTNNSLPTNKYMIHATQKKKKQ